MESLRLDGTTIRGAAQGRAINCVISSVPAGLALPPGQYRLRAAGTSPIYGQLLSIEAVGGPHAAGVATSANYTKVESPGALKYSPAAVATLVPAGQASMIAASGDFHIKFSPGNAASGDFHIKFSPGNAASGDFHIKFAPGNVKDAPAGKFFDTANTSGSPRVIIAVRPIGQNSLVAHAGFSDLAETVQRAGEIALIVG
jgi:hypothetical protein